MCLIFGKLEIMWWSVFVGSLLFVFLLLWWERSHSSKIINCIPVHVGGENKMCKGYFFHGDYRFHDYRFLTVEVNRYSLSLECMWPRVTCNTSPHPPTPWISHSSTIVMPSMNSLSERWYYFITIQSFVVYTICSGSAWSYGVKRKDSLSML